MAEEDLCNFAVDSAERFFVNRYSGSPPEPEFCRLVEERAQ
jgi:hypothetical protein